MRVLAVDTSTSVAAVAVQDDSGLKGEILLDHGKTHSQRLVPMVKDLLESLELNPGDIDVYASSVGPGSFTGLRIGITTIKAMAYAIDKPVVGIPTLDALAYNVPIVSDAFVCPIMDARNNQVYTALYDYEKGMPHSITEYMGIPIKELAEIIRAKGKASVFTGDAVAIYGGYLKDELGERCSFSPLYCRKARASSVAELAYRKASEGRLENCYTLEPFYLRKSQAEREFENKRAGLPQE